jgi:CheY-like chemotaxis protein
VANDFQVLVLEDEPLVSLLIEEMMKEIGCCIAAIAFNIDEAMAALSSKDISLAVLDIDLGGVNSLGVARECRRLGVPVIFVTGYTIKDVPQECLDWPIVPKPFSRRQMQEALDRARSSRSEA